jgi:hypothetical protein
MDDFMQFDATTNLQLGKLLPKRWGIEIPFYRLLANNEPA